MMIIDQWGGRSAGENSLNELLVVELGLLVHLQLLEQFVKFIVAEFLSQTCHHIPESLDRDRGAFWFENRLHGFYEFILSLRFFILATSKFGYLAMSAKKSENSNRPLPSLSTILPHSANSASVGV